MLVPDVVVVFGIQSLQDLGYFYEQEKALFEDSTSIVFGAPNSQQFGTHFVQAQAGETFAENIYRVVASLGSSMSADDATNLLLAVDSATQRLQSPNVSPDQFELVANLIRLGGRRGNCCSSTTSSGYTTNTTSAKPSCKSGSTTE